MRVEARRDDSVVADVQLDLGCRRSRGERVCPRSEYRARLLGGSTLQSGLALLVNVRERRRARRDSQNEVPHVDRLEGITGNFEMEGAADLPEQKAALHHRARQTAAPSARAQRSDHEEDLAAFWRRDDHGAALRDDAVASVRDVIADPRE